VASHQAIAAARATDTGASRPDLRIRHTAGPCCCPENPNTAAVWLTASAAVLRDRVYSASRFDELAHEEKIMVEKFMGRTERYDQLILSAVSSLGFASIDTGAEPSTAELMTQCLQAIG
jgi:hypothetical protein